MCVIGERTTMSPAPNPELTDATYTLAEAAALAGVSDQTVSNWFRGREGSTQTPLFDDRRRTRDQEIRLSFLEVSETIVAALLRTHGATMSRLRTAREFTKLQIQCEHPFATEQYKLASGRILLEFEEHSPIRRKGDVLIDFDEQAGQRVLPLYYTSAMDRFDYRHDADVSWAQRYHPYGRAMPLVIDPRFGSGRLTIAGTNVRAEAVFARLNGGYSTGDIVDDLRLPVELVEAVAAFRQAA